MINYIENFIRNHDEVPKNGRILAYTRENLIYDAYSIQNGDILRKSGETLPLDKVYELHLFNADTECRIVCENGEWKNHILTIENEPKEDIDHFTFTESQYVKDCYCPEGLEEKIIVKNYFSFDEDGFLSLSGYRLAMEGNGD